MRPITVATRLPEGIDAAVAPMRRAYIALGANLGDPPAQVHAALEAIGRIPQTLRIAFSRLYRSPPLGGSPQPDYCNAVCAIETALGARELLAELQDIEAAAGRVRGAERWAARALDLDLVHVEGEQSAEPALTLPHPGLAQRAFVLVPLAEIAPRLVIPHVGAVTQLAACIDRRGLELWSHGAA